MRYWLFIWFLHGGVWYITGIWNIVKCTFQKPKISNTIEFTPGDMKGFSITTMVGDHIIKSGNIE